MKTIFLNQILLLLVAIVLTTYTDIQAQTFPNVGNLESSRLRIQGNLDLENGWQRGMISQNISYNLSTNEWAIPNNTSSITYNDFAMMKFSNNGVISFYTRAVNANHSNSFDNATLENTYKRMTILNNGNVGIGTSPGAKLDVSGNIRIGVSADAYIENTTGFIGIRPADATHGFIMRDYTGATTQWSGMRHVDNGNADRLEFAVMGAANYGKSLVLTQDNKVGIGAIPTNHELEVNGTIRAKEIIVEEGWGDYVFYDDYQLPTLEEEEINIEENGHLLGFESAEEMAGEIQLGDVAKRQQVKIEEVVLHLIELKKEVEQLKKDNGQLKEDNEQLKKQMAEK